MGEAHVNKRAKSHQSLQHAYLAGDYAKMLSKLASTKPAKDTDQELLKLIVVVGFAAKAEKLAEQALFFLTESSA